MTTDTDTKQDTIQRPARAWRNWYDWKSYPGPFCKGAWPTKEIAEQKAEEGLIECRIRFPDSHEFPIYLGAYPEGTRP